MIAVECEQRGGAISGRASLGVGSTALAGWDVEGEISELAVLAALGSAPARSRWWLLPPQKGQLGLMIFSRKRMPKLEGPGLEGAAALDLAYG
jgi:hypothetical protein